MGYRTACIVIFLLFIVIIDPFLLYGDQSAKSKADRHIQRAKELEKEKKYEEAVKEGEKAEGLMPDDGWYPFYIGDLYRSYGLESSDNTVKKSRLSLAVSAYARAFTKGYEQGHVQHRIGMCFWHMKEFTKAEKIFYYSIELKMNEIKEASKRNDKKRMSWLTKQIGDSYIWLTKIYEGWAEYEKFYQAVMKVIEFDKNNQWVDRLTNQAQSFMAYLSVAKGDYDQALQFFKKADNDYWATLCKKRMNLGTITPDYVHGFIVLYVTQMTVKKKNGETDVYPGVDDIQRRKMKVWQGMLTCWIETASNGRFSLSYVHQDVESYSREDGLHHMHSTYSLDHHRELYEKANEYDTYVVVSPLVSPGLGGSGPYPCIPYVIHTPWRGWFQVNSDRHGFDIWLHEFFHVIEHITGIRPAHGYREEERKDFPGWKGKTELDYYEWHFKTTLNTYGWENINYKMKLPVIHIPEENFMFLENIYKDISIEDRHKARDLGDEGSQTIRKDPEKGVRLLKQALDLSPYQQKSLETLSDYYIKEKNWEQARGYLKKLEVILNKDDYFTRLFMFKNAMGEEGNPSLQAGTWNRDEMSVSGVILEWDVSHLITGNGDYKSVVLYTSGRHAVSIHWVALYENNIEVVRDNHKGWSGGDKENIVYHLPLDSFRKNGVYTLKVKVTSQGGTDSNGIVYLFRE